MKKLGTFPKKEEKHVGERIIIRGQKQKTMRDSQHCDFVWQLDVLKK